MLVTEEILAKYRENGSAVRLDGGAGSPRLPANLFTHTGLEFASEWSNGVSSATFDAMRERLQIVLVLAFTRSVPILKPGREWLALEHQCGGYACEQQRMVATRLTPRASVLPALKRIAREGLYAESGHFNRRDILASRIADYVASLASMGLDCEASWGYLSESLYPVDATQKNLNRVAENGPSLELLADWSNVVRARYSKDPVIFFMTENSD